MLYTFSKKPLIPEYLKIYIENFLERTLATTELPWTTCNLMELRDCHIKLKVWHLTHRYLFSKNSQILKDSDKYDRADNFRSMGRHP